MTKPYKLAIHIFRRDLRLYDNTALIEALRSATNVIPLFIFDKRQIETNDYKSDHALLFMANSLKELDDALRAHKSQLYCFYGIAEDVVKELLESMPIEAVYINRDYTPFSRTRDSAIKKHCEKRNIAFHCYADALLNEPEEVLKTNGDPYTIFTPAFSKASQISVKKPEENEYKNYYQKNIPSTDNTVLQKLLKLQFPNMLVQGGRKEALALLDKIAERTDYHLTRNFPAIVGTTRLSAHSKFGTVSIREIYYTVVHDLGKSSMLINELYWRDFFTHIAYHFPHVFCKAFHEKYNALRWSKNEKHYRAWCEGQTGFPIVDAGMRELNATGYMHNRVRMIVASFLTKDLHIDWRWGEQYFASKLVDYDPAVNNGNWQWASSTGCDAQPYFRIFNPWLQQNQYDSDCLYIKHWIPELVHIQPKSIHSLADSAQQLLMNYPKQIVCHKEESKKTKELYKSL
jgi:deoxyribodipyrimidine photo-lyase